MCPTLVFPKDGFAQSVQIKQYKPCPLSLEVNRSIKPNENGIPVFKKSFKFYKLYFKGSFTLNCYITTPQCKSIQVLPLKTYLLLQTDLIPLSAAVAVFLPHNNVLMAGKHFWLQNPTVILQCITHQVPEGSANGNTFLFLIKLLSRTVQGGKVKPKALNLMPLFIANKKVHFYGV